jgi:hypothetical protein
MHQEEKFCLDTRNNGALHLDPACHLFFSVFSFSEKKIHIVAKIGQIKTTITFRGKENEVVRLGRGGY